MAPATRLLAPLLDATTSPHICNTCRTQYLPVSSSVARRYASTSWTEKLRSKLWRGEPGGQKDPYDGEGSIERLIRQRQQGQAEDAGKREAGETVANETDEQKERYSLKQVNEAADADDTQEEKISAMLGDERGYEPAKTWDGLQHVGKLDKIWEDHPKPRDIYRPFMAIERMTAHDDFVSVLKQVTAQMVSEKSSSQGQQPQSQQAEADDDQFKIPFKNEKFQFAYLKRVSQITGYRFPDSQLPRLSSPTRVLAYLDKAAQPKPTKLADILLANERLTSLPNVKIFGQKVSPMERETEVGRWKIIEEELMSRGLPTIGHSK